MANRFRLQELLDARHGRPTEPQAARTIATYAVIPAAIVGLLGGTQLVGETEPAGRLLAVCAATAFGAGLGAAGLVLGAYRQFGFRPVAVLADALAGSLGGLLAGSVLGKLFNSWWPWLLVPVGAVVVPVFRRGPARPDNTTTQSAEHDAPTATGDADCVRSSKP